MSVKGFFRALLHPPADGGGAHHSGDDLAEKVRETVGPLAAGGVGGRLTGHSVYRLLEDEVEEETRRRREEESHRVLTRSE